MEEHDDHLEPELEPKICFYSNNIVLCREWKGPIWRDRDGKGREWILIGALVMEPLDRIQCSTRQECATGMRCFRSAFRSGHHSKLGIKTSTNVRMVLLCDRWQDGRCTFGDRCNYAHGEAELRPLPPEGYEILERLEQRRGRKDVSWHDLFAIWTSTAWQYTSSTSMSGVQVDKCALSNRAMMGRRGQGRGALDTMGRPEDQMHSAGTVCP